MTKTITSIGSLGALILIALFVAAFLQENHTATASTFAGGQAIEAVATTTVVGPQSTTTVFVASNCAARVIGTNAQPIMVLFADPSGGDLSSTTISGAKGFYQAASTTVSYDGGIYGCGRLLAVGYSSSTITAMETR